MYKKKHIVTQIICFFSFPLERIENMALMIFRMNIYDINECHC